MSLLTERMVACARLIEQGGAASDGLGGVASRWAEGETFRAALIHEDTKPITAADRAVGTDIVAVLTPRDVTLRFHDVFRRARDGAVFRVISNAEDRLTPAAATLDLRAARAERWELPT